MSLENFDAVEAATRYLQAAQTPEIDPAQAIRELRRLAVESERECLAQIIPALIEARQIVAEANVPEDEKQRIRHELAHAVKHLHSRFEWRQKRLETDK